jgi:hypothetical protein
VPERPYSARDFSALTGRDGHNAEVQLPSLYSRESAWADETAQRTLNQDLIHFRRICHGRKYPLPERTRATPGRGYTARDGNHPPLIGA